MLLKSTRKLFLIVAYNCLNELPPFYEWEIQLCQSSPIFKHSFLKCSDAIRFGWIQDPLNDNLMFNFLLPLHFSAKHDSQLHDYLVLLCFFLLNLKDLKDRQTRPRLKGYVLATDYNAVVSSSKAECFWRAGYSACDFSHM